MTNHVQKIIRSTDIIFEDLTYEVNVPKQKGKRQEPFWNFNQSSQDIGLTWSPAGAAGHSSLSYQVQ